MSAPLPIISQTDLTAFSFSPSSPPTSTHGFLRDGPQSFPFPSSLSTSPPPPDFPSHVSPALLSPHSAATTASIAQSISQNLGPPGSPLRLDDSTMKDASTRGLESASSSSKLTSMLSPLDAGMEVEDELRRGPPTSDTPGGDCKNVCIRHARMANGSTNLMLQKSIENLAPNEQQAVNTIWSLFSSSPSKRRLLILRGLLTIACPSQLSFLQEALALEMRLDPVELLPREVNLKIFGYLDAISLGRAAQVSRAWKGMADDDLLWRTMCEQHIERKCEKCGWGLPLLGERRRKARLAMNALPASKGGDFGGRGRDKVMEDVASSAEAAQQQHQLQHHQADHDHSPLPPPLPAMPIDEDSHRHKRSKTVSPGPSRTASPRNSSPRPVSRSLVPTPDNSSSSSSLPPLTRPWKHVYCERLAIERNWRRGTCIATVLSGHTDSITCLQVAEDLPHPAFPVLMTGSWDRSVRIWNLETGKEVGVLRGHTRGVRALRFDATKLVTGSMDSTLKIWNWRTGECMRTLRGHRDAVICLTYDRQLLVSGSGDSTIRVWDFGTGEVYTLRGHSEWVNSVALWDSKSDGGECDPSPNSTGEVGAPTSNPELAKQSNMGKYLFSASDDATVRVWDLYTRTCVRVLSGHVAQVQSLKVFVVPTSETLSENKQDSSNSSNNNNLLHPPATTPNAEDGPPLSSCSTNRLPIGNINLAPVVVTAQQQQQQPDFEFSGDRKPFVVSASLDNTIRVWDVEKAQCMRTGFGHLEGVWDVDVDKLRIVSASHDRTLKIWDRDTGRCLHTLIGHKSAVTSTLLTDQQIVSGSDDGEIRVWSFAPSL
ncbi:F-box/WD repeat-containing protein [Sporobolomyces salmoneus]|uniref:F-box/WD repeat-containing protein n=1 Tax=Sporobolomyces salmoneus TaxID=183962 RepID=UPI00317B27C1